MDDEIRHFVEFGEFSFVDETSGVGHIVEGEISDGYDSGIAGVGTPQVIGIGTQLDVIDDHVVDYGFKSKDGEEGEAKEDDRAHSSADLSFPHNVGMINYESQKYFR